MTSSENGVKSEISELEQKIIRQVEYYFGDANLGRDRFLQGQIKEDDGWVPMETMLKFNRLSALSEDAKVIVDALKKSTSGLMEVFEDDTKIRRLPDKPLPANTTERRESVKNRSAYVKGFPTTMTMNDLLEWFEDHGPPENIQMRRNLAREFKGSVFVLFKTKDDVEKFIKSDVKHEDKELVKMQKEDYFKMKQDEKKERSKHNIQKEEERQQQKFEDDRQSVLDKMVKGAILHVKNLPDKTIGREIREFFAAGWVEYEKGDEEAWIRFEEENGATTGWDAKKNEDGKVIFKEKELSSELVGGEAEFTFWKNRFQQQADMRKRGRGRGFSRGGRGRGGRGGRWGKRGGRRDDRDGSDNEGGAGSDNDEPSHKRATTDSSEPASKKLKTADGAGDAPAKDSAVAAE